MLGVDLRQRDKRPAVIRPALQLRQLIDRRFAFDHRTRPGAANPHRPQRARQVQVPNWPFEQFTGIDFQFDQMPNRLQRIPKQESSPFDRAEQIRHHRKPAALHVGKQQRRSPRRINPPLNLRRFQMRINCGVDPHQSLVTFEIRHAFLQTAISHFRCSVLNQVCGRGVRSSNFIFGVANEYRC